MTRTNGLFAAAAAFIALCTLPATASAQSPFDGAYFGANLGMSWGDTSARTDIVGGSGPVVIPPADIAAITSATRTGEDGDGGFTGGMQLGYNWISGALMLGIESDLGFMDINESSSATARSPLLINPPINYQLDQTIETSWLWTVRPRIGYVADTWMAFASVGFAMTDVEYKVHLNDTRVPPNVADGSFDDTKTGWAGSLGGAYAINESWSITGEWLYADFGEAGGDISTPNGFVALDSDSDIQASLLRIGANYRF